MTGTNRAEARTTTAAGLLAALALAVGAQQLQTIPVRLPVWDAAVREWLYAESHQAVFLVALVALSGAAVTAAVPGRGTVARPVPLATALAAVSWAALAPALWAGEPWLRGAGLVLACLLPATLLHLALALRAERSPAEAPRVPGAAAAWAAYLLLAVPALVHALARDPFTELGCLVRCQSVDPVLEAPGLARGSAVVLLALAGAVALVAAATALAGTVAITGGAARAASYLLALSAVLEVAWAWWPGARAGVGPLAEDAPFLLVARGVALTLVAGSVAAVVVLRLRRRSSLRRLAREITEVTPPASMREVVAARLGDPRARLDFYVAADGVWVDEQGRPPPAPEAGEQQTVLRRGADVVARLTTRGARTPASDLEEALGPAALLALEAERTRAEQLLRLRDLRATRRSAVERADLARRRAERDLHDGAQHLLLATSFALQEAIAHERASGEHDRAEQLAVIAADVSLAAGEVRHVAHGIYPVLLGDAGLVPALEGLALESAVPVTVDATPVPRLDSSVELTAYLLAAAAVRAAGAAPVRLAVSHRGDTLRLTAAVAALRDGDARMVSDRAEALGGTMDTMDGTWRLELPCG